MKEVVICIFDVNDPQSKEDFGKMFVEYPSEVQFALDILED